MELRHCPDAEAIVRLADLVLKAALAMDLSDDMHRGGYLCIADNATGEPLDMAKLGDPLQTKEGKYEELAKEKAHRLAENPEHLTSYQSRHPVHGRWGGAIRAGDHIFSFSGLSEKLDEALVLVVARAYLGWMRTETVRYCDRLATLSDNTDYHKLVTGLHQRTRFAMLAGTRVAVEA
jgi:hypothetical protein